MITYNIMGQSSSAVVPVGSRKIVINVCFGRFSLSMAALDEYIKIKKLNNISEWDIDRDDPVLVDIVERLGENASDNFASLRIVEIPNDVDWQIADYDGYEHVEETHRMWA
jgi:hypothetical protein